MSSSRICGRASAARAGRAPRLRGAGLASLALPLALSLFITPTWAGLAAAETPATPARAIADPTSADASPGASALALPGVSGAPILLAQDGGTEPRELEPEYPAPPPGKPGPYNEEEGPGYNSDYLFGMTRGVAGSTMVPALKVPLFLLTVPLDIVTLPFAAIGGFFG